MSLGEVGIAEVVRYTLSDRDAQLINARRRTAAQIQDAILSDAWSMGAQPHLGNPVREGDVFPAIVVRLGPEQRINAQVFLDGMDVHWVCNVPPALDATPGSWRLPALAGQQPSFASQLQDGRQVWFGGEAPPEQEE
ncbi:hypothetical protein ABWU93_11405 [Xanthomonas translucens pv. translucens]|uniref:hypothetical protein n=1 Tax=Xanthomonas campestris pv. translucens TaxID=343 RepID=UPI003F704174